MQTATPVAKTPTSDHLIDLIRKRTANLFKTHQLWCSEAVLSVLNRGLGGDLPHEVAIRLGAGLGEGIGGSGCTCGALTGGAMAIGLLCGAGGIGLHRSRSARSLSRKLHDRFKNSYGSTCCRVLIKGLVQGSEAHFEQCAEHSAYAAALAAALILEVQPERIALADWPYLNQRDSHLKVRLKIVGEFLKI
jgi:C_GCAxxG_C_C family probable redox protein